MTQDHEVHPRRAAPNEPASRRPLLLGGVAVLTLGAVVGGVALSRHHDSGTSAAASSASSSEGPADLPLPGTSTQASSTAASSASAAPSACGDASHLAVDPAWSSAVTKAAAAWSSSRSSSCSLVQVDARPSTTVAKQGLGSDVAWVPEDPTWTAQATDASLKAAHPTTVGTSPLVLVTRGGSVPKASAAATGTTPLVLPPVATTDAGAAAFGSLAQQALGSSGAAPTSASDPRFGTLARLEQRVTAQVPIDQVTTQLSGSGTGQRTGVTTEALALSAGTVRASYLDGRSGLTMAVVNPSGNSAVSQFTQWLGTAAGQQALTTAGVRAGSQTPSASQLSSVGLQGQASVTALQPAQLASSRQLFAATSRRAAAMLVLDTSGSMANPLDPGSHLRKIDLVLQVALQSWANWPPGMATGLITFNASDNAAQTPQIRTVVPITRTDSAAWVKGAAQYQSALQRLQVTGGTPLYQAIERSTQYMRQHYVTGLPNKLIIITDGYSQDAAGEPTEQQLLQNLKTAADPARPVQVIYVALGPTADFATLQQIARATGQTAVQVRSTAELAQKLPLLFR